ncbi:helix-turn-helix domain-containing protein [Winogradskyella sp.]|uniref:helix-turn-helix domain-containing protein n=1 Tax=Winogradskyella sp. TaxID=1883156 RepID=UPI003BAD805F
MKIIVYNSISEKHKLLNFPPPESPLFSVMHYKLKEGETSSCKNKDLPDVVSITNRFYTISLKNIVSGDIVYGRTKYDCTDGTLFFSAPDQTMILNKMVFSSEAYQIAFHEDYIRNLDIYKKIKSYSFFNYNINEALHLTPKEELIIKDIFKNIEIEYQNNQDTFSKEIIISLLEALLKYADRFYQRQFMNRTDINKDLVSKFNNVLNSRLDEDLLEPSGIPSVDWMSQQLNVSYRYMNETIKAETGKSAKELIILFLVEEAKNMLLNPNNSISETAYKLGFEYPQYFTRVFKKKVGMSPKAYIQMNSLN